MKTLFFVIFLILSSFFTKAQDFEVAPVKMIFNINAGESDTKILTIRNHANATTKFSLLLADFVVDNDGHSQEMARNSTKNSCSEWLQPEQTVFEINPGESLDVKIKMNAPADDYSARWAMMYVQTLPAETSHNADKSMKTGVILTGRIAVQIFRVAGSNGVLKASISNITEKITSDNTKRIFTANLQNTGSAIANCKITFMASNLETAEETSFAPVNLELLPGCTRTIQFELPKTLPPGEYSLIALLDYGSKTTIEGARYDKKIIIQK
jgi:hypothetical protein